jgi:DNA-binding PadR family transcriptional regulator
VARTPNRSRQTLGILAILLRSPQRWRYGYDLARETGLGSGSLYPILVRLSESGWLESRWETAPGGGRPPRHLYRLAPAGRAEARALLDDAVTRGRRIALDGGSA